MSYKEIHLILEDTLSKEGAEQMTLAIAGTLEKQFSYEAQVEDGVIRVPVGTTTYEQVRLIDFRDALSGHPATMLIDGLHYDMQTGRLSSDVHMYDDALIERIFRNKPYLEEREDGLIGTGISDPNQTDLENAIREIESEELTQ